MGSRSLRWLLLGMAACAGLVVWAASGVAWGRRCLDGDLHAGVPVRSVGVTEHGCEAVTLSGERILVEFDGPPFEVGVAAVLGFVVLGVLLIVVAVRSHPRAGSMRGGRW